MLRPQKKSRGWSNCVANGDGTFSCKDGQQCGMKQQKTEPPQGNCKGKSRGKDSIDEPSKGKGKEKGPPPKRRRTSEPAACDKSSVASDDSRATWDKRPVSPEKKPHKVFMCKERSVIDGAAYPVLNHWIEATEYTEKDFELTEQQIKIPMLVIIDAASEAISEQNAQASGLDPEEPQWITIDRLVEWLSKEIQFTSINVYSFISKFLSFIAYPRLRITL